MVAKIAVLEEKLKKLIHTLKQNKEQVPLETLKTLYAEPYKALTEDIRITLTEYTRLIVCSGLPIGIDDLNEAVPIINNTIKRTISGLEHEIILAPTELNAIYRFVETENVKEDIVNRCDDRRNRDTLPAAFIPLSIEQEYELLEYARV